MKTYTLPCVIEISGWVHIRAHSLEDAKRQAERFDLDGVSIQELKDQEWSYEIQLDELMQDDEED